MSIANLFSSPADRQADFARRADVLKQMQRLSCVFYGFHDPDWETLRKWVTPLMVEATGNVVSADCASAMQAFRKALAAFYPHRHITIELVSKFLREMQQSVPSDVCSLEVAIQWCCGAHLKCELQKRKKKKRPSKLQEHRGTVLRFLVACASSHSSPTRVVK